MMPATITIHRSLVRPILLGGAERELSLINAACIVTLIFGVGLHFATFLSAIFLASVAQFFLARLGKQDPQMSRVYIRHIKYRSFYAAKSSRLASSPPVFRSIGYRAINYAT